MDLKWAKITHLRLDDTFNWEGFGMICESCKRVQRNNLFRLPMEPLAGSYRVKNDLASGLVMISLLRRQKGPSNIRKCAIFPHLLPLILLQYFPT